MLATLIIWIYILFFSYIYGWTIVDWLSTIFSIKIDLETFSLPLILLAGICGINVFSAFLSLFINLSWLAQAIFVVIGLVLGWRMWNSKVCLPSIKPSSIPWLILIFGFLVFLTVLENGITIPVNPDTGIYHAQAIRWIETYPAVPGLGNLQSRFAYNSNWLVINAFFSFSFLGIRSFHVLPGAFILIALTYFMGGTLKLLKKQFSISSIIKTLLIPLVFYILGSQISSPGTDFPASGWTWITFLVLLEFIEKRNELQQNSVSLEEILVFIFSIYLVTVKLSTVPLLMLSGYILIKHIRPNGKVIVKLAILALIILAPWFARNLILSGYWVYPVPFLYAFSPNWDWKIPFDTVLNEQRVILAWARIPRADATSVLSMPLIKWLKEWFLNLTINQRGLVLGAVFSPIVYALSHYLSLRKIPTHRIFFFGYLVSYLGLIFWLFGAPDIRFGFGFIISTALLSGGPLLYWIIDKVQFQKILIYIFVALIITYQAFVMVNSCELKSLSQRLILPADYGDLATSPCNLHGYTLLCADYYNECWYGPFPCIPPSSANPNVELRGPTLRSGFRVIKNQ